MTKAPAGNLSSRRFFVAEKNNLIFVSVFPYFFAFYKIGGFMPKCSLKIEKSTPCALPCNVFATTGTAASGDNTGANPPNGHARPDGDVRGGRCVSDIKNTFSWQLEKKGI